MKQLMIGICKGCKQLIDEAKTRGVYTIVAGPELEGRTAESLGADEYWNMDTSDVDELERRCKEAGVDAVINGISTFNISICIELARRLGLPCYATDESWHYTVDKYDFKDLCRKTGVPVAKDYFVSDPPTLDELDSIEFPVVVKAVDQSANRGMSYCYEKKDIAPALKKAKSVSKSDKVVIERRLEGREYAAHYAMAKGKASLTDFCCMLSQPGYPGNCYSMTTTETDMLDVFLKEVHPGLLKFMEEAGINEGVCWFEMLSDVDGHLYVIEMGYRMSGELFAIPMRDVNGFDEYKWLNDISLGIEHTEADLPESLTQLPERVGSSYIIWSNDKEGTISKLEGLDEVAKLKGVEIDNVLHVGSKFRAYQYLVVILIESEDVYELIDTVKKINDLVKIEDQNGDNIVIYYDDFETLLEMNKKGRKGK